MEDKRTGGVWMAVAGLLALLAALLAAYVGGYFLRSHLVVLNFSPSLCIRYFPTKWEETLFTPAARMESLITGRQMSTDHPRTIVVLD